MYGLQEELKKRANTPKKIIKGIEKDGKETIQMAKEQEMRGKAMIMGSKAIMEELRSHARGIMS